MRRLPVALLLVAAAGCSATVTAPPSSEPPVAVVSPDQTVLPGTTVLLDGTGSHGAAGATLTFSWQQTSGPSVDLGDATQPTVTFTAPQESEITDLVFQLTVSDGTRSAVESTTVTVSPRQVDTASTTTSASSTSTSGTTTSTTTTSGTTTSGTTSGTTGTTSGTTGTTSGTTGTTSGTTTGTTSGTTGTPANFTKVVSLHAVTRSSIVVFFHTDVSVKATVDYAPSAGGASGSASDASATTHHTIQLTGLSANTKYAYTVHAGTATATGDFWTALDYQASPQPFTFAVAGDARGLTDWSGIASAILAKNPRFIVQTGDNDGDWANSDQAWRDYYAAAQDLFAHVPVFAAQGNHDAVPDYSTFNVAPVSSSNSDTYYAFVYGNAGFVAINGNSTSSTQTNWVKSALSTLSGGPLFAFQHQPLYSCGAHGSSTSMQGTYKTAFENNFVTSNFTGHDHDLIYWSRVNGVQYVVSGGAGTGHYGLSGCQGPFNTSAFGFMMVTVDGASVTQTFYDQSGSQLFTDTLAAHGQSVNFSGLGNLVVY